MVALSEVSKMLMDCFLKLYLASLELSINMLVSWLDQVLQSRCFIFLVIYKHFEERCQLKYRTIHG
jgi:hypothetical protein